MCRDNTNSNINRMLRDNENPGAKKANNNFWERKLT